MQISQIVENIKTDGYSPGESKIFSEEKREEMEQIIDSLFESSSSQKDYSSNAPVLLSMVGVHPRLDSMLDEILSNESVRSTLQNILGEDYKIWEISARYSLPGDNGLGLHQDAWGQMNLAFALNDQSNSQGSTSFLSGSHLLPRWSNFISWAKPGIANILTKPLVLKNVDYAFFINKTWHSRRKNRGNETKKILLFGFFPTGGKFKPLYADDVLMRINPSNKELVKRIGLKEGVEKLDSGFVKVVSSGASNSVPYSVLIENRLYFRFFTPFVYLQVFLAELLFRPLRILFTVYKYLFRK